MEHNGEQDRKTVKRELSVTSCQRTRDTAAVVMRTMRERALVCRGPAGLGGQGRLPRARRLGLDVREAQEQLGLEGRGEA